MVINSLPVGFQGSGGNCVIVAPKRDTEAPRSVARAAATERRQSRIASPSDFALSNGIERQIPGGLHRGSALSRMLSRSQQ